MFAVIVGVVVLVASYLAYVFLMTTPQDPANKVKKTPDAKKGTDSEKQKLRERMKVRKASFVDEIQKNPEQNAGGGVEEAADGKHIRDILMNPHTSTEEMVALTNAIAEASRDTEKKNFISSEKVNAVWKKHRGDKKGPADKVIQNAIRKSDKNNDGVLQKDEMSRITTAFLKHAGEGKLDEDTVFELLDENNDGKLNFEEMRTAFKAMWLMKSNGVQLSEMIEVRA